MLNSSSQDPHLERAVLFLSPSVHKQLQFLRVWFQILGPHTPTLSKCECPGPRLLMPNMPSTIQIFCLPFRDEADQRTSLKLVDGMLPKLKPAEMLYLLPAVRDFISHPSPGCRDVMYNIFMWIYDNFKYEHFSCTYLHVHNQFSVGLLCSPKKQLYSNLLWIYPPLP